jgi:hypothetical protein
MPVLHQTRLKDRDFPSGASYINVKIPALKDMYGYKVSTEDSTDEMLGSAFTQLCK